MGTDVEIYYFGCWDQGGHSLFDPHGRSSSRHDQCHPFRYCDGALQPRQQIACVGSGIPLSSITHKDGWTAWGFWDRTFDTRGGSNSAFIAHGIFTEEQMRSLAREHFPTIWARLHRKEGTWLQIVLLEGTTLVKHCGQCPILEREGRIRPVLCPLSDEVDVSTEDVPLRCPLRRIRVTIHGPEAPP